MNEGIAKIVRADMKRNKVTHHGRRHIKIPRPAKRFWASLNHWQRGELSASWDRMRTEIEPVTP